MELKEKEKEIMESLSKMVSDYLIQGIGKLGQKIDRKQAENVLNNIVAYNLKESLKDNNALPACQLDN